MMKVLIGCEFSGVVRDAFRKRGHDAWSCDLVPSLSDNEHHLLGDVRNFLNMDWDLAIFHTPCTYLCHSGVRWLHERPERWELMRQDALLFKTCMDADIPRIAMENPVMHGYALDIVGRKYDQTVQPWMFGHPEMKKTCLWLKNLPKLIPTNVVSERSKGIWNMPQTADRGIKRSVTFQGIADAMAEQWGTL